MTEDRGRQLVSTLVIEKADLAHAGRFTCAPSYAKPDTVTLHVVDGEFLVGKIEVLNYAVVHFCPYYLLLLLQFNIRMQIGKMAPCHNRKNIWILL